MGNAEFGKIMRREVKNMHIHQKIYEFAASAGAFEGYV
jgi:hypothetical protein